MIITISMMVLLSLLVVGLLSLSSLALRGTASGNAEAEARANARMALMMAIGDLQKSLGSDRSVSAPASLVLDSPSEPNLIGAWESWHWDPGTAGSPSYSEKKDGFRRWLVSSSDPEDASNQNLPATQLQDSVWLVNPATVGATETPGPALRATIVEVEDQKDVYGGFAYAVMDESLKASIDLADVEPENTGEEIAFRTAPSRLDPEMIVSALDPDSLGDPRRLLSLPTAVLATGQAGAADILGRQHELTTGSVSLLTNVVRGGFKKDLTTGFESNIDLATVFGNSTPYFNEDFGAPTWDYLRSHYQHYKSVTSSTDGTPRIKLRSRDMKGGRSGIDPAPEEERLMPVIAKLQIVFSLVTHHNHDTGRKNFYDNNGDPKGYLNYALPHIVYDPVVTLYNPYDVALELEKLRVQISSPPVVFGFRKKDNKRGTDVWLRPEHPNELHGLNRFQVANERNPNAPPKYFTLLLSELRSGRRPGDEIVLNPGEVKVFSPWVEEEWDWGLEVRGGFWNARAFFDWDAGKNFGTSDGRTNNNLGVETVPGWDARAGLQTDHLSYASRPAGTRYPFEEQANWNQGWVAIRLVDEVTVWAKPGKTQGNLDIPDFQVDLLAGRTERVDRDYLRSYSFNFGDVESELSGGASDPLIKRTFLVGDLLQTPDDPSPGGKSPFAILTMSAKTTVDPKDVSMPWLHNHPVTEGAEQDTRLIGNALDTYDVRFEEMQDFNTFPGVEFEPTSNRGFFGASATANRGVSNVPMFRVPVVPASSLGDLIPANLVAGSTFPRVTHPLGSSRAHPLIPANSVTRSSPLPDQDQMLDHAYLLNDALWDDTYFSTVAKFDGDLVSSTSRKDMLEQFLEGEDHLLNPRFIPLRGTDATPEEKAEELDGLDDEELMTKIGGSMAIKGGFNINSDSVDAWSALLSSMRDKAVRGWSMREHSSADKTSFPRSSLPLGGDAEDSSASTDVQGQIRWAGFRALSDEEIRNLAEAIVEQLRKRGVADAAPSLSLAEFVNRRIGSAGELHTLAGLLETAIEQSGVNEDFHQLDSREITGNENLPDAALTGLAEPEARIGKTGSGAPSILTQGDLLMSLAPVITARGDTFRIRAYGDSRDAGGKTIARAWCEAVVQRMPEYVDPSDEPELAEAELNIVNKAFGRRFIVTSFRWLSSEEI